MMMFIMSTKYAHTQLENDNTVCTRQAHDYTPFFPHCDKPQNFMLQKNPRTMLQKDKNVHNKTKRQNIDDEKFQIMTSSLRS